MERSVWTDERLDDVINRIDRRFDRLESRLDRLDSRVDQRFESISRDMNARFDSLQRMFALTAWSVAGLLAAQLIAGITAALVALL